ncbi:shikimate kinase [uncultured Methylibium sp.]|uniref:shikimate kinase n=1 Tax=uncultured Methylibium sp. TaxID=381093 RepID=UPI0025E116B1|nr:shikimate kinase [uncultured Methylibium sp.]
MRLALVGLPGSGKSSVGRLLARRLDVGFLDTDSVIEKRLGEPIRSFFDRAGEARFREIEQAVVAELCADHDGVLATGGGAVLREANRRALHDSATVIYLRSSPDELQRRLRHDTQRPLLQVKDPRAKLQELYRERDPLYRETAHFVIETGRPTVHTLVGMILMQLELAGIVDPARVPSPVEPPR